jgi:prefoldin subunit 5
MQTEITMSRNQVIKLHEIVTQFKQADELTLVSSRSSGIGQSIFVQLELTSPEHVMVDLTEYELW